MVDVVAQLYQLQANGQLAEKIVLTEFPASLTRLLTERSLVWDELSGLVQRALLWDAGLVLTDGGQLVQVHVPCGKTMHQIFLSKDVFDETQCGIDACNQKNLHFAREDCSIAAVQSLAQCAIAGTAMPTTESTVWSEDGDIESVPNIRVYRRERRLDQNASAEYLFTINQESTVLRTTANCPAKAFFTVPCTLLVPQNAGDWCAPTRGGFIDVWLDNDALSTSSGSGLSTTTMVLLILAVALVLGCALAWAYYSRTRRKQLRGALSTMLYSGEDLATLSGKSDDGLPPIIPLPIRTDSYYAQHTTRNTENDDELLECDMLDGSMCRHSEELALLCSDRDLMLKRIPYSSLKFTKLLGRGASGEVWQAEYNGQTVAVKSLLQEKQHDHGAVELFAKEIRLASCLEHPNIVRFIGLSWRRVADICSVTEYMARGDLSDLMYSKESTKLSWQRDKMCIAIDIASALAYLHSLVPSIIHRDLKSHNVLLNEDLQAKISDFGLSRERSFEETMTNGIGTLLWTAPEILRGEAYTEKADIFSYGIVLSELDTCLMPYSLTDEVSKQQLTSMQLMHLVTQGQLIPRFRDDCPVELEELAKRCLAVSPAYRPSAAEIVFTLRSQVLPSLLGALPSSVISWSSSVFSSGRR
ncbi:hypothetical protein Poli38472_014106 [Pythium oligandrum]|uniref:Protein kinase domain-containing protein n=1 Tax=Pythium oligandrum TaxID=41045 RepID=A0A8K1FMZ6_PYTOL|nr:hypothetical protein Poli38472_014106 [Pythium oligandrum]|eukprot:TMW66794.1 hypothetical protein Poli38472_014106 [Pythium oligandrum]